MKHTKTKLLSSMLVLVLALVMATTATFAWFSMNSKVSVTGLDMNVTTQGDLFISADGMDDPDKFGYSAIFGDFSGYLAPIMLSGVADGVLTFKDLSKNAAGAIGTTSFATDDTTLDTRIYNQTLYFKSASQYDVYLTELTLAAEDRTYTGTNKDLAVLNNAVNALEYYVIANNTIYVISDVEVTAGKIVSAVINKGGDAATTTPTNAASGVLTIDTGITAEWGVITDTTIMINGKMNDGTSNSGLIVTDAGNAADFMVYQQGQKLIADATNTLRIAFVTTDADGNDVVVIVDPTSKKAWSGIVDYNMAHEYYTAIAESVGEDFPAGFDKELAPTEIDTDIFNFVKLTEVDYLSTKLFTLLALGSADVDGVVAYGSTVEMYIWMEGTDADSLSAAANQLVSGNLGFRGVYLQEDHDPIA